ncbi:hypothetical protein FBQ97_07450 [Acidobacteria bacterium ACD]|nr:MAG: hypothetical protein EDX89_03855 [Acidobacteriota bacterium]MCE7956795.1 hypothetical protein [Acidobacteria bacterium ACB2]MDL1949634.1 hypothetical protein [Acidobacteria bacterium ACD]
MRQVRAADPATAAARWWAPLSRLAGGALVYLLLTGLPVRLLPFSPAMEWTVILHTVAGVLALVPIALYLFRHAAEYWADALTPNKVLGWLSLGATVLAVGTGVWATALAFFSDRVPPLVRTLHLVPSIALLVLVAAHIWPLVKRAAPTVGDAAAFLSARKGYLLAAGAVPAVLLLLAFPLALLHEGPRTAGRFPEDYRMPYGPGRPFAPSLARTVSSRALAPEALDGSASCGTSGCHQAIYDEWAVSAHRWAALDPAFQRIQEEMAKQNGPESTRYCGGCHDPISLFSGNKTVFKDELTHPSGLDEGVSCLSCHAIVQTDVQGNADYVVRPPKRYLFETSRSPALKAVSYFLIRSYPQHHVDSLGKRLFKTPEYCGACHKQFVDQSVNSFGWVQLQNQYDNWRKSKWNHPKDARKTVECRECHMPLLEGSEPGAGDVADYNRSERDGKHRSHRFLGANQYMPTLLKLEGGEEQVRLVHDWLGGKVEVPEIADKWAEGPIVKLALDAPETVRRGEEVKLRAVITSSKVGHDFPTGPLDIIQSWIQLEVKDAAGNVVFSSGKPDEANMIPPGSFLFKAEPVDRYGNLIDRHNLWEMVGVRYRRSLFPGYSDTAEYSFACPGAPSTPAPVREMTLPAPAGAGPLTIEASLNYRKLDQFLINFMFPGKGLSSPVTTLARATARVAVVN